MPKWKEEKERLRWLIKEGKLTDDEPCKVLFPRMDANKRIQNKEKAKRIVMQTDEQNYSEFHAMREAYTLELDENPTLVVLAIIQAMRTFDVRGWKETRESAGEQA
jgi:hypothetical protein